MLSALTQWSFEPVPVVGCGLAALLYAMGMRGSRVRPAQRAAFVTGLALLLVALVSPLDTLNARWQWVHMTQHVVLLLVAPPLLLLGRPFATAWAGLQRLRPSLTVPAWVDRAIVHRPAGGGLALLAVLAFSADMLAWHIPGLYNLTLRNEPVHDLEHTCFLATGLLFWAPVLSADARRWRLSLGARAAILITAMAVSWALAVVIGYATHPLYAYAGDPAGLTALADQQIAAGVMWVPGSVPFVAALVWLLVMWFDMEDRGHVRPQPADIK